MHMEKYDSYEDVEEEMLGTDEVCHTPIDIRSINIIPKTLTISNIVDRLRENEIILDPDYQRRSNLWGEKEQSRLIESLIIMVPLPTFYFDQTDDEKYEVIDGVQRLTAIRRFIVESSDSPEKLKLKGMEYLSDYDGCTYEILPKNIQRRINEQSITAYVVGRGTDKRIKESIFTRINTGGLSLSRAEIRNAVYSGRASKLVKELASSEEFVRVTRGRVRPDRMLDREFVTRFFAFYLLNPENYIGQFEEFLSAALDRIRRSSDEEIGEYRRVFILTMDYCLRLFGDYAFRRILDDGRAGMINKPLFDSVSVSLARLSGNERTKLLNLKDIFLPRYKDLLQNEEFRKIISNATATRVNIERRYEMVETVIRETLDD